MSTTANARYLARQEQIKRNLEILKKLLKEDAKDQKKDPENWGFTGSIGEVGTNLEEMVKFMGGNPVKLMGDTAVLLYPTTVKKANGETLYVTIPKD